MSEPVSWVKVGASTDGDSATAFLKPWPNLIFQACPNFWWC